MPKYLRAFLFFGKSGVSWEVGVHRSLEEVMQTWAGLRKSGYIAVFHAGFDRPATATFSELEDKYSSQVFLTQAGASVLPEQFKSSKRPKIIVEGEALFHGLVGWGYEAIEEADVDADPTSVDNRIKSTGWVSSFVRENPGEKVSLDAVGIHDENSYLQRESGVGSALRLQLQKFRFASNVNAACDEPDTIVQWLPDWAQRLEIRHVHFSVRAENALYANGIQRVVDLKHVNKETLHSFRALGRKSVDEIISKLRQLPDAMPPSENAASWDSATPQESGQSLGALDDPCELAAQVPFEIANLPIRRLNLPVRAENGLAKMGVTTVADLANMSSEELLQLTNFGRRSLRDLLQSLREAVARFHTVRADSNDQVITPLFESFAASLEQITERSVDVLKRRSGWGQPELTLAEIGEIYGVTRERIRQIEAKAIRNLLRGSGWPAQLEERLRVLLQDRAAPLPLAGLGATDEWFVGFETELGLLSFLIDHFGGAESNIVEHQGVRFVSRTTQNQLEVTIRAIREYLAQSENDRKLRSDLERDVSALVPNSLNEFQPLLVNGALGECQFSETASGDVLIGSRLSQTSAIIAALEASERPLHYSEVAKIASRIFGSPIDERYAHNQAASVGILLGRGTYGLRKHIITPDSVLEKVARRVEERVREFGVYRQWHASELAEGLVDEGEGDILDPYVLDWTLKEFSGLRSHGRLVWDYPQQDEALDVRVDRRQAVLLILEKAGEPLPMVEIERRLNEIRGTGKYLQLFVDDLLIRTQPGVWGINDRDAPLPREEQKQYQQFLLDYLETRLAGVHRSEVASISGLPDETADALISIACLDKRISYSSSQYLYMSDWGEPRRPSVTRAVEQVLETSDRPLPYSRVVTEVEQLLGRTPGRGIVSGALQAVGSNTRADGAWELAKPD